MHNERKINKTFSNVYTKYKLDKSNNSEDFEFISIEDNKKNNSVKIIKRNHSNFYFNQRNIIFENEKLETNLQLNNDYKDNKNLNDIKTDEIYKEKIIGNKNELDIFEINKKVESETVNKVEENNPFIEQMNENFHELDDLIDNENMEDKNEIIKKVEEEKVNKSNNENLNKSPLINDNKANDDKKIMENLIDDNGANFNKDGKDIGIKMTNNKTKENNKIIINNPLIGEQNIEQNSYNSKNINIKNNENKGYKEEIENSDNKKPDEDIKEEPKINKLNINKQENNSNQTSPKGRKIKLKQLKILKDNSKENPKENSGERMIPQQKLVQKSNTLDDIGKISAAKMHRDANRILKQINKFNKNTKFCPCCCLPCPTPGVLVHFSYCDDTDDFIETGQGTSLYFFFFKYSMIIMAATAIIIGIPILIFSYTYTYSLQKLCNNYYINRLSEKIDLMEFCELYITEKEFADDYYSVVDSPFFLFSSINIKDYRKMFYKLYNKDEINFEKAILRYPLMNLICSITLLIVNILSIIIIYNKNMVYDFQLTSPSDFTVMITNMKQLLSHYLGIKKKYEEMKTLEPNKVNEDGTPYDFEKNLREELGLNDIMKKESENKRNNRYKISKLEEFTNFVENNICIDENKEKYNVQQINICYKLNQYMNLEEQLHWKKTQIIKIEKHPYQIERNKEKGYEGEKRRYFSSFLSGYNLYLCNCWNEGIELSQIKKEKEEFEQRIQDLMKASEDINENNFAGVAFVSFNTLKEQEDFLSQFPSNIFSYFLRFIKDLKYIFCFCCYKKNLKTNLDAKSAPEPEDVIYENLEYSYIEGNFRTLIVYIISIILIGICFGIFIGINMLQDHLNEKAIHQILSYVISLINTCVSSGLNFLFQMILDFLTKMEKQYTMTEYYRSYSVKLTLFTFFTSAVVPLMCELIKKSEGYQILISNMLMMFLVNAFVTPIMWTMNFTYFLKKFQICLIERKSNADSKHNMTQRELNELYELPSMSISYKYSYLAKTLLMTFLYIPIFPLGVVISLVGFILGYLLEKFNYAHMYKRPEMLNHKLCVFYVNHLDVMIFVYAIGDYIFMHDTYKDRIIPLIKIIVFGVLTVLPYKQFLKRNYIGISESDISSSEFKDKYFTFSMDYERANPITRKKGTKHYLEKMLKSGKINKIKYLELIHEIESLNLMEVYYKTRENKYLFDVQKNFAQAMGKKFLNLQKDLENNNNEDNNDGNKLRSKNGDILYIKEENVEMDDNNNEYDLEIKDENEKKEQEEIADMYNNPNFMNYGITMQLYKNVFEEKLKQSTSNAFNENENGDNKEIILLNDKI